MIAETKLKRRMMSVRLVYLILLGVGFSALSSLPINARTFDLIIEERADNLRSAGQSTMTINGQTPGPLLRFKEGEIITLNVANKMSVATSIHWHGLILPHDQDGVPAVSFDGIAPGTTFTYSFPVVQSGVYWYHSHTELQEQSGVYGQIVIDPVQYDGPSFDREYVITLSDHSEESPSKIMRNLKRDSDYYNNGRLTIADLFKDASKQGWKKTFEDRRMWGGMRMTQTDISDVTGATYTFLMNGLSPDQNWSVVFNTGDRVRLRFINSAAMTYFDLRIPGLKMTVIQADGNDVFPVEVDELRIAVAETYDVIVEPQEGRAYAIFAETLDRSGYARGTLAPREGMTAELPELRERPRLTMFDMRGAMPSHDDHSVAMDHASMDHASMDRASMGHASSNQTQLDRNNEMLSDIGSSLRVEPRSGLAHYAANGGKVLTYGDLTAAKPVYKYREPDRQITIRITGNMERYIWSFDDVVYAEADPIYLTYGERVRFEFINETMMNHPLHLHGMWMLLDVGKNEKNPVKHTINVAPGDTIYADVEVDARGDWVFHCHLLYHMSSGMFREVVVEDTPLKSSGPISVDG